MQFLRIDENTTFQTLSSIVGARNIDGVLSANNLKRSPNIGQQFAQVSAQAVVGVAVPTWQAKSNILNTMTGDADVFEAASLMDDQEWKLMSAAGTFNGRLRIPENIRIPDSVDVLGGSGTKVSNLVYTKVMKSLQGDAHIVDPSIFNDYSSIAPNPFLSSTESDKRNTSIYNMFNLPWGKITLYSSLSKRSVDFPVYPEEISDSLKANYQTMPGLIYQYEPWYVYESSGPRSNSYKFTFHRDMWSGNHLDGKANELIRFCEANCYPEYNGSAVNASIVTLYVNGSNLITGIMTSVSTDWSGPIGLDGWYLVCELTLDITEVSPVPLSHSAMQAKTLIGEY